MKHLKIGNLVFFPLNSNSSFLKSYIPKYCTGTLYGALMIDEIYTLDEIKDKYPDIKEVELLSKEI